MESQEFLKKLETSLSGNSPHTLKNYLLINSQFLEFIKKSPEQANEDDAKNFLVSINKSPSSIIMILSALKFSYSSIFNKDITLNLERPKNNTRTSEPLTNTEVLSIINSEENPKSKLIISLLYSTGMRVSELTNLKVSDIDFFEKTGKINTNSTSRIFNISDCLIEDLKNLAEKQKFFNKEYLFSGKNAKISERNIQKIVHNSATKAGILKQVHCHTLRESFAKNLLERGTDIKTINFLLGKSHFSKNNQNSKISLEHIKKVPNLI